MADQSSADTTIHPQWQDWIVDNLARGAEPGEVARALSDEGIAAGVAEAWVAAVVRSPVLASYRRLTHRTRALEQIVRLRQDHRQLGPRKIECTKLPRSERFFARHYAPGAPGLFDDLVPRWPAYATWSFTSLRQRFGEVTVEVCHGREHIDRPDAEWASLRVEQPLGRFLAEVEHAHTNNAYMIAKNQALARPGLQSLLADITPPAELFEPPSPTRTGLWIGPAHTQTVLHHDGDNSMFCQVVGRKRVRLYPPESLLLLEHSRGVYSQWSPADVPPEVRALGHEVVVEAGQALFIPAGWWHDVEALAASITVTLLGFTKKNAYTWYRPGTLLRGRG